MARFYALRYASTKPFHSKFAAYGGVKLKGVTMTNAEIISTIALIVSMCSVSFSLYFGLRDRGKLKATSKFYAASEYGPAKIVVNLVNTGRRPINLRLMGGSDENGLWSAEYFNSKKEDFFLKEHGQHEVIMTKEDLGDFNREEVVVFDYLWVEDSLGKRHTVKESKNNIKKIWAK